MQNGKAAWYLFKFWIYRAVITHSVLSAVQVCQDKNPFNPGMVFLFLAQNRCSQSIESAVSAKVKSCRSLLMDHGLQPFLNFCGLRNFPVAAKCYDHPKST